MVVDIRVVGVEKAPQPPRPPRNWTAAGKARELAAGTALAARLAAVPAAGPARQGVASAETAAATVWTSCDAASPQLGSQAAVISAPRQCWHRSRDSYPGSRFLGTICVFAICGRPTSLPSKPCCKHPQLWMVGGNVGPRTQAHGSARAHTRARSLSFFGPHGPHPRA